MKTDNSLKTKQFAKKGIILWFILLAISSVIQHILQSNFTSNIESKWIIYINDLIGVIFVYGLFGIPLILMLSVLLLYAERGIDKLAEARNRKNQNPD
jgi:hypothetical protein